MANMSKHCADSNFDDTVMMAHRLKASAAEFGALRLSGLCGELDSMIKRARSQDKQVDPDNISLLVKQIETAYARAYEELKKLLI